MITRRSFLTALSCLPFVGKLIPRERGITPISLGDRGSVTFDVINWHIIESYSEKQWSGCTFRMKDGVRSETHTDRCDCAGRSYYLKPQIWDQRYQA